MVQPSFDVDRLVLKREPQVIVEFVVGPFGPGFGNLVDFTTRLDVFMHQATDLLVGDVRQFSLHPITCRFGQRELDVAFKTPVGERVLLRLESSWIIQRCQRASFRLLPSTNCTVFPLSTLLGSKLT